MLGPSEAYAITSEGQTAFFWAGSSGLKPGSSAQGFLRVFKMVLSINEGGAPGTFGNFGFRTHREAPGNPKSPTCMG